MVPVSVSIELLELFQRENFPPYISSILKLGEQEGFRSEEYNNSKCAVILLYFLFRV